MKKIVFAFAAVLLASASAHAESDFDGLYAGVNGSYASAKASIDGDSDRDDAFSGGAFAGYGTTFGKFYLGGEAAAEYGGFENSVGAGTLEKKWGYGATGRAGYLVTKKVLGYGMVGWERARVEATEGAESDKLDIDGLKFGAGVETVVKDNVSVRSELTHTSWDADNADIKEIKTTVGLALRF